ncbi:hypothetical protein L484_024320 [Morus notabilis]|uniref:F-box/LRR-repeat protein n=1 Tax=Morus notabilis TaxID=981085 RepID=W9QPR2_9ROSA|nr:F-box/LRR-repeat protein At3g48880 [Morus notabilis]EXB37392.1 hypothetical protein L484_024320 [Morus notabilis]
MTSIGANCKNFSEIKILCSFDLDFADAIVTNAPNLKFLSLRCTVACKEALLYALKSLEHLEVLNLTHLRVADKAGHERHPAGGLLFREVDNELIENASRLKKFITCTDRSCPKCNGGTIADEEFMRGNQFDEEQ